jgi:hypothetical protein
MSPSSALLIARNRAALARCRRSREFGHGGSEAGEPGMSDIGGQRSVRYSADDLKSGPLTSG